MQGELTSDTENLMASTLSKFAEEQGNTLERKDGIQRNFSIADKLDDRNVMKFKGKMDPGQTPFSSRARPQLTRKQLCRKRAFHLDIR